MDEKVARGTIPWEVGFLVLIVSLFFEFKMSLVVRPEGFEPPTVRLRVDCSTN